MSVSDVSPIEGRQCMWRRKSTKAITPAADTTSHHLEPRRAATMGSTIIPNKMSQPNGPITSKEGPKFTSLLGVSIISQTNALHATPSQPRTSIRCAAKLIASIGWERRFQRTEFCFGDTNTASLVQSLLVQQHFRRRQPERSRPNCPWQSRHDSPGRPARGQSRSNAAVARR